MNNRIIVEALNCNNSIDGVSRVSALVDGVPLWFESSDAELYPSPEGFGSVLLVSAMSHGRDIVFEDPLCPVWLENTRKLMDYFSKWRNWKPIKIEAQSSTRQPFGRLTGKRVLCFSGGVDSFYSLLTYPASINTLIMVHGYDIYLNDDTGGRTAYNHVRDVAAAMSIDVALIRTNYREHPVAGRKYRYAYGGALSGIGHLVNNTGELIISSGFRYDSAETDGSHWQTDPLWSSETMKVIHYGAQLTRDEKTRVIATNPLVRKHLRICQQNLYGKFEISEFLNCGRCQKCVRTLLVLQQAGGIDALDTFQNKSNLDVFLDKVMKINYYLFKSYEEICRLGVDKKCEQSIRSLMRRSRILNKIEWTGRRGQKTVFNLIRLLDFMKKKINL